MEDFGFSPEPMELEREGAPPPDPVNVAEREGVVTSVFPPEPADLDREGSAVAPDVESLPYYPAQPPEALELERGVDLTLPEEARLSQMERAVGAERADIRYRLRFPDELMLADTFWIE